MFLVVWINYFFPHTETVTSEVPAKLLTSHSKPTMRTWLRIHHQVSPQEWVASQASTASLFHAGRANLPWELSPPPPHWAVQGCQAEDADEDALLMHILSPTHPAARNVTSGSTGRHASRDSLVSPPNQWICPDNATELQLLELGFSGEGGDLLGLNLIDCHLQWEESCHLKSQFFKL